MHFSQWFPVLQKFGQVGFRYLDMSAQHLCRCSLGIAHRMKGLPKGSCSTCSAPPQSWSLDLDCCKAFWLWGLFAASSCTSLPTGLNWESPNCGWPRLCARQSFRWEAGHDDRLLSARGVATHAATTEIRFLFFASLFLHISKSWMFHNHTDQ